MGREERDHEPNGDSALVQPWCWCLNAIAGGCIPARRSLLPLLRWLTSVQTKPATKIIADGTLTELRLMMSQARASPRLLTSSKRVFTSGWNFLMNFCEAFLESHENTCWATILWSGSLKCCVNAYDERKQRVRGKRATMEQARTTLRPRQLAAEDRKADRPDETAAGCFPSETNHSSRYAKGQT